MLPQNSLTLIFGHPSDKILNSILDFNILNCINCEICKLAKQTKLPFSLSTSKSEVVFYLVHSDFWGLAPINSYNGFKYFVLFIDIFQSKPTCYIYLNLKKSV